MEAKGQPLIFLCDEQILEIPFFQRSYVWNEDNWKELLEDLFNTKGSHFLGSIILKREKIKTGEANKAIVIDGQQRLTTLSILIKAVYDLIQNKSNKLKTNAVDALFFTLKSSDSEYQISIRHSHNDCKAFENVIGNVDENGDIISPLLSKIDSITDKNHLIERCYKYFFKELQKRNQDEIIDLWDSLFDKNNNILVVIDLDDNDQEQKIFDTINSSGVRLTSTDIIKNALYQKLIELTKDDDKVSSYYKSTWEKTFEDDAETIAYWTKEKSIGRLMRQNSELLLQTVAIINGIFDTEKHQLQNLADLYKSEISKYDENQLKNLVSGIMEYAEIYKAHIIDFDGAETFEYNNANADEVEKRISLILDKNDISTFNPYIVYIFKKYKDDEPTIIEKLCELEKYVMWHLITKTSTKKFNKDCSEFIKDKAGKTIKEKLKNFSTNELKAGLSKVSNKLASIILFWIELKRHQDPKYDTKLLQYKYQLEHIMPQKWETNWKDVPYVDENGNQLPSNDESKVKRYSKVYSLGNMTLLNGRLNASISNDTFKKKMEGNGKKKGVKDYSSLSITKEVVDIYSNNEIWNEKTISDREKELADEVVSLWGDF